jgi:hypothetical protein
MLDLGFLPDSTGSLHGILIWRVALEALYNAVLIVASNARLDDISQSG